MRSHGAGRFFFGAFVIAEGAGAEVAKVDEVVMAGVIVGPDDVYAGAGGDVNLDAGRFSAGVDGYGHQQLCYQTDAARSAGIIAEARQRSVLPGWQFAA